MLPGSRVNTLEEGRAWRIAVAFPPPSVDLPVPVQDVHRSESFVRPRILAVLVGLLACGDAAGPGEDVPSELRGKPIGATAAPTQSGWASRTVLWSPDGREVYHVGGQMARDTWIEAVDVQTGETRTVTEAEADFLQMTANATWVNASAYDPRRKLGVIRRYAADGGGPDESFELESFPAPFSISSDGTRVLHQGTRSYELMLTVVGDTTRLVVRDAGQPHSLSPDASTAWEDNRHPLILLNSGGTLRLLNVAEQSEISVALASDRAEIRSARLGPAGEVAAVWVRTVCVATEPDDFWGRCRVYQFELRLVDLRTGTTSTLARVNAEQSLAPAEFSPDGAGLWCTPWTGRCTWWAPPDEVLPAFNFRPMRCLQTSQFPFDPSPGE